MLAVVHAAGPVLASSFDFLGHPFLGDSVVLDWLRIASAIASFALTLIYLRIAFGTERPQDHEDVVTIRFAVCAQLAALIPAALTELQQVGHPFVVWRLPFVILANIFGWWYVKRRL